MNKKEQKSRHNKKYREGHKNCFKEWKRKNPNYMPKYLKEYSKKNPRKEYFKRYHKVHVKIYIKNNPEKYKARYILRNAIASKKVLKPDKCSKCTNLKPQAHHPNYSKPLDVIWLCRNCHMKEHYV